MWIPPESVLARADPIFPEAPITTTTCFVFIYHFNDRTKLRTRSAQVQCVQSKKTLTIVKEFF
jgi:hypothetical protein